MGACDSFLCLLCCTILTGSDEIIHPCIDFFSLVRLQLCIVLYLTFEKAQALITLSREVLACSAKGQTISLATFDCGQSYWVLRNHSLDSHDSLSITLYFSPSSAVLLICRKKNSLHDRSRPDSGRKQANTFSWACSWVAMHQSVSNYQMSYWAMNIICSMEPHTVNKKLKPLCSANYCSMENVA